MTIRVYKYRLRTPIEGQAIVREQLRAETQYRNDLCTIERARRAAIRALEDTEAVRASVERLKAATRSTRKEARRAHKEARRDAREQASVCQDTERLRSAHSVLAALSVVRILSGLPSPKLVASEAKRELRRARAEAGDRLAAIALLDEEIRGNLYEHSPLAWGSKLTVHAAADQFRRSDLYDEDEVTPRDPHYRRSNAIRYWPSFDWSFGDGQVSVHVQNRVLTVAQALGGQDAWIRIADGDPALSPPRPPMLSLRVGSEGRLPVWATLPIYCPGRGPRKGRLPRAIADGKISWARVRCEHRGPRGEGRGRGEIWTATITVEEGEAPAMPAIAPVSARRGTITHSHARDDQAWPETRRDDTAEPRGIIAIEVAWDKPREDLVVARWRNGDGEYGSIEQPRRIWQGLEKASSIRSVRDTMRGALLPELQRLIQESSDALPRWLVEAAGTLHLWRSAARLHDLARRWRGDRCDAARGAYDRLQDWELRDAHLWAYEDGLRTTVLRSRLHYYRNLARRWERTYRTVILDDRRLQFEARFGEASELRFQAGPAELRGAIESAFGRGERVEHARWKEEVSEEDDRDWCERAIDAHLAGGARDGRKPKRTVHGAGGAWGARLSGRAAQERLETSARKQARKAAE